jgi:O-antigen/teichoic acid export membrane protein
MLLSHLILPGPRSKLELDRDSAKEMMGFAKWVFVSTILTFIGTQIDRFFVPKLAGFEAAGLYGRALGLLGITTAILSTFNSSVIYPIFGRLQAEGRSIADYYPRIHQILSILGALLMSGLVATGPSIARLLYPAEYGAVGWLLQIFAFGAWFQMIQDFIGSGLLASGRRRAFVLPSAIKAAAMLLLLVPSWWLGKRLGYGDLVGIAVGWLAINVVTYVSAIYLARASGIHVWKTDFPMAAILVASSVAGLKLGKLMSSLLGTAAPNTRWGWFAQLLVMGTSTLVIWAAFLVFAWRRGTFDMLKRSRA